MNYLNNKLVLFIVCVVAFPYACQEVDQGQLQQQYLESKIADYKAYKWRSCMKEIMEKAEERSDSFFVSMAKTQTFDSTQPPNPITRPGKPEPKIREDTIPLGPILRKKLLDSIPSSQKTEERDSTL